MSPKELDDRIKRVLQGDFEVAKHALEIYEAQPACCRMVSDSLIRRSVGHATPVSLGMVETSRYVWRCPTCNRCVLDQS